MWCFGGLDISLDGRLSVEFDGKVHYVAAFEHALWRGVGPAAGDVDAHGRPAPYYLVVTHHAVRVQSLTFIRCHQCFAQQGEGSVAVSSSL